MCVIIDQPAGTHLDKQRAQRLWNTNPDGGGFAFNPGDGIQIQKHMKFNDFWRAFERARSDNPGIDFMVHMRITTHGKTNIENTHPFVVDEHTVMAHNGIFQKVKDYKDGRSDTKVFIDEILPHLPEEWLDDEVLVDMVEDWIGWSRLMFMTTNPKLKKSAYFLNADAGVVRDGMWFSNSNNVDKPKAYKKATKAKGHWTVDANGKTTTTKAVVTPSEERVSVMYPQGIPFDDEWPWAGDVEKAIEALPREALTYNERATWTSFLNSARKDRWLNKEIVYVGDAKWECMGCDESVDNQTGECKCWGKICADCKKFATECDCRQGFSSNLILLENASEKLQERAVIALEG